MGIAPIESDFIAQSQQCREMAESALPNDLGVEPAQVFYLCMSAISDLEESDEWGYRRYGRSQEEADEIYHGGM